MLSVVVVEDGYLLKSQYVVREREKKKRRKKIQL